MAFRHAWLITIVIIVASSACSSDPETESDPVATVKNTVSSNTERPATDPESDEGSRSLQVDLQEGFDGSAVEILIDGAVVFAAESIQTVAMTGFAEGFAVEVTSDVVEIELRVAGESVGVDRLALGDGLYVGLSVEGGASTVIQMGTAFGYG